MSENLYAIRMDSSAASSQGQNVKRGVVSKCAHGIPGLYQRLDD